MAELAPPDGRPRVSLTGLISAAGWLAFALTAASVVGQRLWPISLFVHFWPQMILALLASTGASLAAKKKRSAIAQGAAAALLVGLVAPHVGFAPSSADADPAALVAMFANVERSNDDVTDFLERVAEVEPDIIGIAEVDPQWAADITSLAANYPHQISEPRTDNFGIALLSRSPLADASIEHIGPAGLPSIFATIDHGGRTWRVVVTHPIPPFVRFAFGARNAQLAGVADRIGADSTPAIVLGDLNATLWSPALRDFRRDGELESAAGGFRALYTWPARQPLLMLGLDHCMHTASIGAIGYDVLESVGSDHFPVVCSFRQ